MRAFGVSLVCLLRNIKGPESRGFKERAKYLLARVNKDEDALAKLESVALQEIVDLIQVNVYVESSVCIWSFMLGVARS